MPSRRALLSPLSLAAVALALLSAEPAALAHPTRAHTHAHVRPHAFASCARLVGYAKAHFAATRGVPEAPVRPLSEPTTIAGAPQAGVRAGAPAPAAAGASPGAGRTFSTTNNQEPGVEEPDVVKTDGTTVFAIEQGTLYAIDATQPAPRIAGSLSLGGSGYGAQLLLRGTRLLVISGTSAVPVGILRAPAVPASASATKRSPSSRAIAVPTVPPVPSPYFYRASTTVSEVDVANPAAMSVARTFTVEGSFVDARQNGSTARLVIASPPPVLADAALASRASGWIPERRFHSFLSGHRSVRPLARCSAVSRPATFSGLGMLSILTIDLDRGLYTVNATALMADAQVVYGSQHNLYVATQRWVDPSLAAGALPAAAETVIDEFDASDPERTTLVASGTVPGYLLNQFSLSEQAGYLRVASTSAPIWWGGAPVPATQSYVTVLADHAGSLVPVGQVAGLGAGQRIYSVRFLEDVAYVVTFRSVDPLYTIDLSSPTAPRVAGTLELAGYSAYLHPLGAGLLLGIGQAVGAGNEPAGTQLELFDVSDPAAPQLLARTLLGEGSSSAVQYEHHAFLFWPPSALAVLPVSVYPPTPLPVPLASAPVGTVPPEGGSQGFSGAIGFHIERSGIREVGRIAHDPIDGFSPPIERSLVIGSRLLTLSSEGVMASDLDTLARLGFVGFPAPPAGVGSGVAAPPAASRR